MVQGSSRARMNPKKPSIACQTFFTHVMWEGACSTGFLWVHIYMCKVVTMLTSSLGTDNMQFNRSNPVDLDKLPNQL